MPIAVPHNGEDDIPGLVTYRLDLPFPVSANRLWRSSNALVHTRHGSVLGAPRVYISPLYRSWITEADRLYLTQKRAMGPVRMLGRYTLECVFSSVKRSPIADGDNLNKCINDWLQRVEIVKNDCLCDAGYWCWGEASSGASIKVVGTPYAGEA